MGDKIDTGLVGVAGEYFVAGELSRRGVIASITLRNTAGVDIIASKANGEKSISIQVKTNSEGKCAWILNKKAEDFATPKHYYVFVSLKGLGVRPDFYVVPSEVVADYVSSSHAEWLSKPKKNGEARKDTSMRKFEDPKGDYLEKWNLLELH